MITFLRNNFDPDYQLQLSGALLTIKEHDSGAKLKEVRVALNDYENSFAFVMDRCKIRRCNNRKCDDSKRDECNNLHSKVCNFLQFNQGLHKGCDAIIVTYEGSKVFFTICDLKSKNLADCGLKFKMAKALVSYLCEVAAIQDCQFFLQFVVFKIKPSASRHLRPGYARKEPGNIEIKTNVSNNFEYSQLSFYAHEAATKPKVTLKRIQEGSDGEDSGHFYTYSWACSKSKP